MIRYSMVIALLFEAPLLGLGAGEHGSIIKNELLQIDKRISLKRFPLYASTLLKHSRSV
jgi:hypothetical protein